MTITFLLNGETVSLTDAAPTATLLDWLRETRGLTGTKEGCNEGDCGACTVMVEDTRGAIALNACILFLPQLHGKAVRTVEGLAGPNGQMHPVQKAMVTEHGSQCGFCTPGFVMSMATAHRNGAKDFDNQLAGNLCRCTGYAPIIRAAETAAKQPKPDWLQDEGPAAKKAAASAEAATALPGSSEALASLLIEHPEATLIAGATDVGLWVTKMLRDLPFPIFLHQCEDLKEVTVTDKAIRFGAMATIAEVRNTLSDVHPGFAEMLRRYASEQIRGAATIGGNIANGSPIGDSPPPLIALGATLHLRKGDQRRDIPLEDFFLEYGKLDLQVSEFVEAVSVPRQPDRLKVYKLSKRFDQDISAVLGAFNIAVENGAVSSARIAFGGLAGTPKRALKAEAALIGEPWTVDGIKSAQAALAEDFSPMTDMRASAAYRMESAQAMLARACLEDAGQTVSVLEVKP